MKGPTPSGVHEYVFGCVVDGRPYKAISNAGLKLIIAELDPSFAAATPHPETLKSILVSMHHAATRELLVILKTVIRKTKSADTMDRSAACRWT